jgi:calcineurin-like phosphoesterase family protein
MGTVFFIGDTHFGHEKLITGEIGIRKCFKSVEEHDQALEDNWNKTVRSKDVVYHLGDVTFGNFEVLARLKGDKKLVMGNHDKFSRLAQYFTNFYGAHIYNGFLLTHIPVNTRELEFRFKFNIHGHLHDKTIDDRRYINVSCEQINYTPISLDEIRELIK